MANFAVIIIIIFIRKFTNTKTNIAELNFSKIKFYYFQKI